MFVLTAMCYFYFPAATNLPCLGGSPLSAVSEIPSFCLPIVEVHNALHRGFVLPNNLSGLFIDLHSCNPARTFWRTLPDLLVPVVHF